MLKEFREFALKGSVVDLAVGVIIGAAFGTIVSSLVDDMIMPLIGAVTGGCPFGDTQRGVVGAGERAGQRLVLHRRFGTDVELHRRPGGEGQPQAEQHQPRASTYHHHHGEPPDGASP